MNDWSIAHKPPGVVEPRITLDTPSKFVMLTEAHDAESLTGVVNKGNALIDTIRYDTIPYTTDGVINGLWIDGFNRLIIDWLIIDYW